MGLYLEERDLGRTAHAVELQHVIMELESDTEVGALPEEIKHPGQTPGRLKFKPLDRKFAALLALRLFQERLSYVQVLRLMWQYSSAPNTLSL